MPNQLIHEQSPYLLQHAHNPVDWMPWGDAAFDLARAKNLPVLVSIGYSACHWCHVMEHESFEDADTAAFMNAHFVCVKVDREEHPDVDQYYMDAVQAISGGGGWPLNVFVTPDRHPFFGGTYYPPRPAYGRPSWMELCSRISALWNEQTQQVREQTKQLGDYLSEMTKKLFPQQQENRLAEFSERAATALLKVADQEAGGFGQAPKFPGSMAVDFLLQHHALTDNADAIKQALLSLDKMACGGIYDQLGGGFARYATDKKWLVPHFEKMLYDNALLLPVYCSAWLASNKELYRDVVLDTIRFINRELKSEQELFFCALDADSEGEEGKYYVWSWEEWIAVLGRDRAFEADYLGVTPDGNWEGTNILNINRELKEVAAMYGLTQPEAAMRVKNAVQQLFAARSLRVRPGLDDKCLLSWNALINIALLTAGVVFESAELEQQATTHLDMVMRAFDTESGLMRVWKNGSARIPARLDDVAFLIWALWKNGAITGNEQWLLTASELVEAVIADYSHEEGFFYYSPKDQTDIPSRKVELYDGATPSVNAVMAQNLWVCGIYMENSEWVARAESMMMKMQSTALRNPYSYGLWAQLIQKLAFGPKTVVCTGADAVVTARAMIRQNQPLAHVFTCKKEKSEIPLFKNKHFDDKKYIFVCSKNACYAPVTEIGVALALISQQV